MSYDENTIDYAALANEVELVETEGDETGAATPIIGATIAISLRFCPTSACTSRC